MEPEVCGERYHGPRPRDGPTKSLEEERAVALPYGTLIWRSWQSLHAERFPCITQLHSCPLPIFPVSAKVILPLLLFSGSKTEGYCYASFMRRCGGLRQSHWLSNRSHRDGIDNHATSCHVIFYDHLSYPRWYTGWYMDGRIYKNLPSQSIFQLPEHWLFLPV